MLQARLLFLEQSACISTSVLKLSELGHCPSAWWAASTPDSAVHTRGIAASRHSNPHSEFSVVLQHRRSKHSNKELEAHTSSSEASHVTSDGYCSSSKAEPSIVKTTALQAYISQELVSDVSSTLNRLTGYENINRLKASVAAVDDALSARKKDLQAAKLEYDQHLVQQNQLHREVTALLQRKSSWVPADVARFTELYAAEHATEQAVSGAKARYTALSDEVEVLQLKLLDLIRERYQQEQAWSDKIRQASTWWTWGLMGLHFTSFLVVYTLLEPRKRAALTAAVAGMLEQHTASIDHKLSHLVEAVPAVTADAVSAQQDRRQQQQQKPTQPHRPAGAGDAAKQPQQQQASAQLRQQVLQELAKVQQQLAQLQAVSHQQPAASPVQQQLPHRQWLSQGTAAVQHGWQTVRLKSQRLLQHLNPLQVLGPSNQGAAPNADELPAQAVPDSGPDSPQAAVGADGAAAAAPSSAPGRASSTTAGAGEVKAEGAGAGSISAVVTRKALWQVLSDVAAGSSPAVEVTRQQLAALGAAASVIGAAIGAALVVLCRPGGGAAGGTTASG